MKNILAIFIIMISSLLFMSCEKEINKEKFPKVQTTESKILNDQLIVNGKVIEEGGGTVVERGICYSCSVVNVPNLRSTYHISDKGTGSGIFQCEINLQELPHLYDGIYVRAYAVNNYGASYGDILHVDL